MIEGLQPAEFRREWLSTMGKASLLPNENRYNNDGTYAFKVDSRNDYGFASLIVCKLVDEIVLKLEEGETIDTGDLDRWHVDYAKAGLRAANMAHIAYTLEQDPEAAVEAITELLAITATPPMAFSQHSGYGRGH